MVVSGVISLYRLNYPSSITVMFPHGDLERARDLLCGRLAPLLGMCIASIPLAGRAAPEASEYYSIRGVLARALRDDLDSVAGGLCCFVESGLGHGECLIPALMRECRCGSSGTIV